MGIEVKRPAMQLGRASVQALARTSPDFDLNAAPTRFYMHNVFIPSLRHKARTFLPAAGASQLLFL